MNALINAANPVDDSLLQAEIHPGLWFVDDASYEFVGGGTAVNGL